MHGSLCSCSALSVTPFSSLSPQARSMIQTKAPQWKEQLEASRNPSNSHSQGLLAASHGQGYPPGRLTPTHLEMVSSPQTASALAVVGLQLPLAGCQARPVLGRLWHLLPCPASVAFPGQDEGKRVYGLQWGNVLGLAF